jgi:hypothetical protein
VMFFRIHSAKLFQRITRLPKARNISTFTWQIGSSDSRLPEWRIHPPEIA